MLPPKADNFATEPKQIEVSLDTTAFISFTVVTYTVSYEIQPISFSPESIYLVLGSVAVILVLDENGEDTPVIGDQAYFIPAWVLFPISTVPPGHVVLSGPADTIGKGITFTSTLVESVHCPFEAIRVYCIEESGFAIGLGISVFDKP